MPSTQLREVTGGQTIANIATSVLGNADTSYTYLSFGSRGYRYLSFNYTITATTMTIEASNDPDSVSDGSASWFDVSTDLLGAANVTATGTKRITTIVPYARLRFKRVTTNATNAFKLDVCLAN